MVLFKNTKVLITGGDGFIGSYLTRELVKDKAKVILLVHPKSNSWRIKDLLPKIKIIKTDISNYTSLRRALVNIKPQKIFHLAAQVNTKQNFDKSNILFQINTQGTINLLCILQSINYDRFIYISTLEEYGDGPAPFQESQPVSPISSYSASKAAATLFCKMYYKIQNRPIVILRLPPIYGGGQEFNNFIPQVIESALEKKDFEMSKGEQYREFIYITDVVNGLMKAAISPKAVGEVINLGGGVECRLRVVAGKIVKIMGSSIKILPGALPYRKQEIWHLCCDNTKAKKLLSWQPKVGLDDGLSETIKWYQKYKDKRLIK